MITSPALPEPLPSLTLQASAELLSSCLKMDSNSPPNKFLKLAKYFISSICGIIAAAFIAGIILVVYQAAHRADPPVETATVLLGMFMPFALFFGLVAWRGFASAITEEGELISVRGWRIFAYLLLAIGILGNVIGDCFALLLPGAMASICMMKDKKFMQILTNIGL